MARITNALSSLNKDNKALDKAITRWERKAYMQSLVGNEEAVESQRIFQWLSELRDRRNNK